MTEKAFPVEDWLLNLPLYSRVEIGSDIDEAIKAILSFKKTMDNFCPGCQQNATFLAVISLATERAAQEERRSVRLRRLGGESSSEPLEIWNLPVFEKSIVCTRAKHFVHFYFVSQKGSIIKIGQYPSLADMAIGDTSQFEKALGKNRLHELNKAIGLAAHGVGIGSYVYLRRIFESLIEEAHKEAQQASEWDENEYQGGRSMKDRVSMLKNFLPTFIVEHPELYSILSLGVHELSEENCLHNFEALKSGILVIAEEKLHKIQQAKRYKEASQAIATISSKVRRQ